MAGGRPSDFKKKFCKNIIETRAQGKSIAQFRAEFSINASTYYRWRDSFPEFREACEIAKDLDQSFWENKLIDLALGTEKSKKLNANIIMFILCRRFSDYYKKEETKVESTIKADVSATTAKMSQDELREEFSRRAKRINLRKDREKKETT